MLLRWRIGCVLFLLLLLLSFSSAWDERDDMESVSWRSYMACLARQTKEEDLLNVTWRTAKAVVVQRGDSVYLSCFDCLAPPDEELVRAQWKPATSRLAQRFRRTNDYFTQRFYRGKNRGSADTEWAYEWEFAKPGGKWEALFDMRPPETPGKSSAKLVEIFRNRTRNPRELDDLFGLRIWRATHNTTTGFYRCINRTPGSDSDGNVFNRSLIGSMYFVDVLTKKPHAVIFVSNDAPDDELPSEVEKKRKALEMDLFDMRTSAVLSNWSACSRCGYSEDEWTKLEQDDERWGEQTRTMECWLTVKSWLRLTQETKSLALFGKIPCASSQVPKTTRDRLWPDGVLPPDYTIVRKCKSTSLCSPSKTFDTALLSKLRRKDRHGRKEEKHGRVVSKTDEMGETHVVDVVPEDELDADSVEAKGGAPPLRAPVRRSTLTAIESDVFVISCAAAPDETSVRWKRKLEAKGAQPESITWTSIKNGSVSRVALRGDTLVILHADQRDEGQYMCYSPSSLLLASYKLKVDRPPGANQRLTAIIRQVVKLVSLELIFVLIVQQIF